MGGEKERLATGDRVHADQTLAHRLEGRDLLGGQVNHADGRARVDQGVLAHQIFDLRLGARFGGNLGTLLLDPPTEMLNVGLHLRARIRLSLAGMTLPVSTRYRRD